MTSEQVTGRLNHLLEAYNAFALGLSHLNRYEEVFGGNPDGFIHSVRELAEGTYNTLSTAIRALETYQAYNRPARPPRGAVNADPPAFGALFGNAGGRELR